MICDYPFKLQLLRVLCEKVAEAIFLFNQDDKILMNTLDYSQYQFAASINISSDVLV